MFTEILNNFLNVRNKVKDRNGNWVDMVKDDTRETFHVLQALSTSLSAQNEIVLLNDTENEITLEYFEISSTSSKISMRINNGGSDGRYSGNIAHVLVSGSSRREANAENLEGASRFSTIAGLHYLNNSTGSNIIYLKRPITLNSGCRVAIFSDESSGVNSVTYKMGYRRKIRG